MGKKLLAVSVFALLFLCGCEPGKLGGSSGGGGGALGQLYVSTPSAIERFSGALTATGNVAPATSITGAATGLSSPQRILLDRATDRLFVANPGSSSILVFDAASTKTGNAAFSRSISGASTLLVAPTDLALDTVNDVLYVADGSSILVYLGASTTSGNVPPVHNITLGFAVGGILLDSPNNRLYVADIANNAIDRLEGASVQNGAAVIAATITGAATGLAHPGGMALDALGRLIVGNTGTPASLTIFASAATASGNVAPAAIISGTATLLAAPEQLALNTAATGGDLYVADNLAGSIFVFTNIAIANGNIAPARTINGASTGLTANAVNGLALDTTR